MSSITGTIENRKIFIKGLNTSYYYVGYAIFNAEDLDINNN